MGDSPFLSMGNFMRCKYTPIGNTDTLNAPFVSSSVTPRAKKATVNMQAKLDARRIFDSNVGAATPSGKISDGH